MTSPESLPADRVPSPAPAGVDVLGVSLHDLSLAQLLEQLRDGVLVTPHVAILMRARQDPAFHAVLHPPQFRVVASRPVPWACLFPGTPVPRTPAASGVVPASRFSPPLLLASLRATACMRVVPGLSRPRRVSSSLDLGLAGPLLYRHVLQVTA